MSDRRIHNGGRTARAAVATTPAVMEVLRAQAKAAGLTLGSHLHAVLSEAAGIRETEPPSGR